MARPEKKPELVRSLRVDVRLTPAEQSNLFSKATAQGLTVSDYIRLTVLNSSPIQKQVDPDRAALIAGMGQLGKIGSNLNQIAHELNRQRITGQDSQVSGEVLAATLGDLKSISSHLLNILHGSDKGTD